MLRCRNLLQIVGKITITICPFANPPYSWLSTHRISLDFQARVNGKHVDLFKLWSLITARGGYDAVTAEKLAWRRVGNDFNLGSANAAAYAFALKTLYYKNLVWVQTCRASTPY